MRNVPTFDPHAWWFVPVAVALVGLVLLAPEPGADGGPRTVAAAAPALDCRFESEGAQARRIAVTNVGPETLPQGTALAWAATGTPAPRGQMRALPTDLAPGASAALALPFAAHGAGCRAVVVN